MSPAQAAAWITGAILAAALWTPVLADEPGVYIPELHPTYREEVPARRRLARGADDPLTKAASKACGIELDFCIRLRPNMRREVMMSPEADFFSADKRWGLAEMRLYGTRNKSERDGTARSYRTRDSAIFLGVTLAVHENRAPEDGGPFLVTFRKWRNGKIAMLDKVTAQEQFSTDCYVTDITGDGLIDVAVAGNPGVSGGGSVTCATILHSGQIKPTGMIRSAYGVAGLVDLDGDGVWEIETSKFVEYTGGGNSYQFNCVSKFSQRAGDWQFVTDLYPSAFRRQRRFYEALRPVLKSEERKDAMGKPEVFRYSGKDYALEYAGLEAFKIAKLLRSWDDYARDDT